ncbi:MAG: Gfo/Idh/MocA family oxidoreductase [Bacteroidales bacterium]|nr:Gfo/Idh/MocA family oxidoreductase [Bacteroidales bacterium]
MKRFFTIISAAALLALMLSSGCCKSAKWQTGDYSWPYKIENGTIVTLVPERPAGQESALGLIAPKVPVVRVGFVGIRNRGAGAIDRWTYIEGTQIVALCDYEESVAKERQNILKRADLPPAALYWGPEGYKELCERDDIDLVYIATDWKHHFPIAKYALEHGKHVVSEVPAALTLDEIWQLINLAESKRLHCMMLENCCYDFFELNSLNMAQQGVFGEILRVEGAYIHNLTSLWGGYWKEDPNSVMDWRIDYNLKHRGDIYPTHGLGPVAQVLNIHRGDRMKTLVAMDTKAVNGPKWVSEQTGEPCEGFRNGENTTTLIRTENEKVIEIQHEVTSPRPYNRLYQLDGTKGFANKYPVSFYALEKEQFESLGLKSDKSFGHDDFLPVEERAALEAKYRHPIVTKYEEVAKKVGGHGGMDFIMDCRLVYCLQHGLPLDMDVYDLAEWCCLAELGAMSMDLGNLPVAVPDFTRGNWDRQQGFRHAFASPEEEAAAEKASAEFTAKLKEEGRAYWAGPAK